MTQPPVMVLGFPSRFGFILRASPVLFAADAIYTLILLVYYLVNLRSLREVAQKSSHSTAFAKVKMRQKVIVFSPSRMTLSLDCQSLYSRRFLRSSSFNSMRDVPWTTVGVDAVHLTPGARSSYPYTWAQLARAVWQCTSRHSSRCTSKRSSGQRYIC